MNDEFKIDGSFEIYWGWSVGKINRRIDSGRAV
jgi:hypothetical protein